MVRLKQKINRLKETEYTLFQFHNGSIKAFLKNEIKGVLQLFQFHNGSIKARGWGRFQILVSLISIPQWFD